MSIFYQLNMFKILRYFTKHSTLHKPTGQEPMSPNEYHYYDVSFISWRKTSMLKYWTYFKYVSTHSVSSETYNQIFRTKTYNKKIFKQNKRERNREKKERWPPLRTLCDATSHSAIHPSSLCLSFYFWLICRKQYRSNWSCSMQIEKNG